MRVPLIVAGPGIVPGESPALVNSTDLYATILELAGRRSAAEDSISFVDCLTDPDAPGTREFAFFELFRADATFLARGVRGRQYKLVQMSVFGSLTEQLYDLKVDPGERFDLLPFPPPAAEAAYRQLRQLLP